MLRPIAALVVLGLSVGLPAAAPDHTLPLTLAVPGRANAHASIASDGDTAVVAWTARDANGGDVYAATIDTRTATASAPVRVSAAAYDAVVGAERAPRVAIATVGGVRTIAVLWTAVAVSTPATAAAAAAPGPRMLLALSTDGGRRFGPPIAVSAAGATGIRGWASLSAGRDGTWHATWLDGRGAAAGGAITAHAHHHPTAAGADAPAPMRHGAQQDLYHAVVAADGSVSESRVAANVCFCCKTATVLPPVPLAEATSPGNAVIAWRHIYPGSERDIAVGVRGAKSGTFAQPVRISDDHWKLEACPDDGPALTASGTGRLHAVWPTAVDDTAEGGGPQKGIFHARSTDGRVFTPRLRLDEPGRGAAHPQIASHPDDDEVFAVWDQLGPDGRVVVGSSPQQPRSVEVIGPGTYPAVAPTTSGFIVAMTEGSGDTAVVRVRGVITHVVR
jgi:hypothetical protein